MAEEFLFTEGEWEEASRQIVRDMTAYIAQFRAPVFEDFGDYGQGWGSGGFLRLGNRIFLLTNEHVARAREHGRSLVYQHFGCDDLMRVKGNHVCAVHPFDLALLPVDSAAWADPKNQSRAISLDQIALVHSPAPRELLAFTGFAGENVDFYFGSLTAQATCWTAREVLLPEKDPRFSSRFHFGLDYRPNVAVNVIGNKGLPSPPGLSGSVVWDTGFVRAKIDCQEWKPGMAKVTGIVWGWPSDVGCLVATRAEALRAFLEKAAKDTGV